MGGIRPKFGARFGPKESIRAGENSFAWNSALFRLSPVSFIRQADARNWVMPNIRRRVLVQISPSLGGQSPTRLCLFGIARRGVRAAGGAGVVSGAVSLATENEQMVKEGQDLSSRLTRLRVRQARTEIIDCTSVSMPGTLLRPAPKLWVSWAHSEFSVAITR